MKKKKSISTKDEKKKLFYLLYLGSIAFLPWLISLSFQKCLEPLITYWWNTHQFETLLNSIQEKHVLERFIESEELFLLDEIIKEYPKTYIQKLPIGIHKETIQLVKTHNKYYLVNIFFNFSTNIIFFIILSSYLILSKDKLLILNSWGQEFLYNLSDTKKVLLMIFVIELTVGYHSTGVWELLIDSFCHFGSVNRGPISSILVSIIPVILHSSFYYWVFQYLNRISPSLVVIFRLINR